MTFVNVVTLVLAGNAILWFYSYPTHPTILLLNPYSVRSQTGWGRASACPGPSVRRRQEGSSVEKLAVLGRTMGSYFRGHSLSALIAAFAAEHNAIFGEDMMTKGDRRTGYSTQKMRFTMAHFTQTERERGRRPSFRVSGAARRFSRWFGALVTQVESPPHHGSIN